MDGQQLSMTIVFYLCLSTRQHSERVEERHPRGELGRTGLGQDGGGSQRSLRTKEEVERISAAGRDPGLLARPHRRAEADAVLHREAARRRRPGAGILQVTGI